MKTQFLLGSIWQTDRADIPNQIGFKLFVFMASGDVWPASVEKDASGCHYLVCDNGKVEISRVKAWRKM